MRNSKQKTCDPVREAFIKERSEVAERALKDFVMSLALLLVSDDEISEALDRIHRRVSPKGREHTLKEIRIIEEARKKLDDIGSALDIF